MVLQNFWIGTDFTKLLSSLPIANERIKAMLESQRRNLKALDEANQHAIEAFHAVFNRQNEILHSALEQSARAMANVSGENAEALLAKQAEIARTATEHTLENLCAISEMVAQASEKAGKVLNKRMKENIEELKALTDQK